ncbi:unnamed protein product, partial [Polarella glacialis]
VGLVILGAAAWIPTCGALTCLAARGLFLVGATSGTYLGSKRIATWQQAVLRQMLDQLPQALVPLSPVQASIFGAASLEASRRLLAKLGDKASWKDYHGLGAKLRWGHPVKWRPSDARRGRAWSTSFQVQFRAARVFQVLQRLSLSGSLEPGCKVLWSRPVDGQPGTTLRYLAFSNWFLSRDFFSVCRPE